VWETPTLAEARRRADETAGLNVFISLTDESEDGPVVAVKDLIDVQGAVTTAGSPLPPDEPARRDAPLVARLRAAGCVVIGGHITLAAADIDLVELELALLVASTDAVAGAT